MAFTFAYTLSGSTTSEVKDFPLDTLVNYQNGVGTNGPKQGDLVFLNAGLLKRTKDAATPKAIGALEGVEFLGLVGAGQPYAATDASITASAIDKTRNPNGVGKVRLYQDAVYRVPVKAGQTVANANVGASYGIFQDAAGDQTLDLTNTTNVIAKVLDYSKDGKTAFVLLATNTTI